jgi:hypothetical protein
MSFVVVPGWVSEAVEPLAQEVQEEGLPIQVALERAVLACQGRFLEQGWISGLRYVVGELEKVQEDFAQRDPSLVMSTAEVIATIIQATLELADDAERSLTPDNSTTKVEG